MVHLDPNVKEGISKSSKENSKYKSSRPSLLFMVHAICSDHKTGWTRSKRNNKKTKLCFSAVKTAMLGAYIARRKAFGDGQWETFLLKTTFKKHIYMLHFLSKLVWVLVCFNQVKVERRKNRTKVTIKVQQDELAELPMCSCSWSEWTDVLKKNQVQIKMLNNISSSLSSLSMPSAHMKVGAFSVP